MHGVHLHSLVIGILLFSTPKHFAHVHASQSQDKRALSVLAVHCLHVALHVGAQLPRMFRIVRTCPSVALAAQPRTKKTQIAIRPAPCAKFLLATV